MELSLDLQVCADILEQSEFGASFARTIKEIRASAEEAAALETSNAVKDAALKNRADILRAFAIAAKVPANDSAFARDVVAVVDAALSSDPTGRIILDREEVGAVKKGLLRLAVGDESETTSAIRAMVLSKFGDSAMAELCQMDVILCPRCNENSPALIDVGDKNTFARAVRCEACLFIGPWADDDKSALEKWHSVTTPDSGKVEAKPLVSCDHGTYTCCEGCDHQKKHEAVDDCTGVGHTCYPYLDNPQGHIHARCK